MRRSHILLTAMFRLSGNLNSSYPEKNRVQAKRNDQCVNDDAPLPNPEWIPFIERKENIRWAFMSPHVKEYVGDPSKETTEIDRLEGISHFFGKKPEKPIDAKDGCIEPSLSHINDQT